MKREAVTSSNLVSVGYDQSSSTLEIEFKDGRLYQYFGVPPNVFRELVSAPSVGQFFHQNVRGRYTYARL